MAFLYFGPALKEEGEGGGFPLNPERRLLVEGRTSPLEGIVLFGVSGTGRRPNPQGFAQSHIEERHLPPLPYKP